ncbi:MAG: Fe-S-cluster containining protein [Planctomycetota bacterium]|jgi:Fe-S-cluster containining protein
MSPNPWYHKGLRFECQRSGNCCKTHGEYAYVYLAPKDVRAIAAFLELSEPEFLSKHCAEDEGFTILRIDEPACPFLGKNHDCTIYPVRPKQCGSWPFWRENLDDKARWEGAVSECCAGIGKGPLYNLEKVEEIADDTEDWYVGESGKL